ncbi:MAG TPA: response regulator transcription factor [Solirubrobacteraceae bacterium]|nr:response regulator transcription factor [Solirubrobacteraceae bacterium]
MVADSHPLVVDALHALIGAQDDLAFVEPPAEPGALPALLRGDAPDVTLLGYDLWLGQAPRVPSELIRTLAGLTRLILIYDRIDPHQAWQALHAGAVGLVSRGAPTADFVAAVRHALRGGTFLDATMQDEIAILARHDADPGTIMLSPREQAVLQLGADGLTTGDIAKRVNLSASTVKLLLHEIYRKLDVTDRAAAVAQALRRGLIS